MKRRERRPPEKFLAVLFGASERLNGAEPTAYVHTLAQGRAYYSAPAAG